MYVYVCCVHRIVSFVRFSPYTLQAGEYSKSTPVVVTLLRRTDEVPHHTANVCTSAIISVGLLIISVFVCICYLFQVFTAGSMRGDDSSIIAAAAVVTWLSKVAPFLVPFALYMALLTSIHKGLVMDCITGLQFGEANAVPTSAIGVATKVEFAIEACAGFIKLCNELRDNNKRQLVTGTFSMRFAPAQRGYLQMAENQSTVWFEAVIPNFGMHSIVYFSGHVRYSSNVFIILFCMFENREYRMESWQCSKMGGYISSNATILFE